MSQKTPSIYIECPLAYTSLTSNYTFHERCNTRPLSESELFFEMENFGPCLAESYQECLMCFVLVANNMKILPGRTRGGIHIQTKG